MDKYENIEVVGEGSYGIVMKCRHKETGQLVAIKKFLESVENVHVRKLAFREIRMLKRLRHENLVSLIEVFRRKKRFYLVFEYLDHTILDELEEVENGLGPEISRRYIFQVLRGLHFCHTNQVMHRDIKPENVLVSSRGVIKLCDFGFARIIGGPHESCTDYVATRWYRAPELLVGETRYGRSVDTWAAGCLYAEMLNGEPLFPGDSDLDQLFRITRLLGGLCGRHQSLVNRNNEGRALKKASIDGLPRCANITSAAGLRSLRGILPGYATVSLDFLAQCLRMDPDARPTCGHLLQHSLFLQDGFADKFSAELREHVAREAEENPLVNQARIIGRTDERRFSVLSLDESARICSGAARWHMKLMKDSYINLDRQMETNESSLPAAEPHNNNNNNNKLNPIITSRQQSQQQPQQRTLQRPRDICLIGPSPVTANSTYIRRLEGHNKGLLQNHDSFGTPKDFSLPLLAQKAPIIGSKRTKLDLPSRAA